MGDISRRSVITAGAWSVPTIAIAVAAPAAAASVQPAPSVTINSITWRGFSDWYTLALTVENIPAGVSDSFVVLTWTPTGGSTIGPNYVLVDSSGDKSITLVQFPTGVEYLFTATATVQNINYDDSFPFTF